MSLALDLLSVEVVIPGHIDIKMAVPLEFTTIEQKREYELAVRKKMRAPAAGSGPTP